MKQILLVMGVFITTAAPVVLQAQDSTQQSAPASSSTVRKMVSGRITDEKGAPLADVTVQIKGSPTGTKTNSSGVYSLNVPENATLVFSFVGMGKQEISTIGKTSVDVQMKSSADTDGKLEDVIVVGYGTQKVKNVTGSIVAIDTKKIEDIPVITVAEALRGQVPGVDVSGGSSRPGSTPNITIRQTFNYAKNGGYTTPLVIIDDVMQLDPQSGQPTMDQFNMLDLSEVESITVLKDASAAIYGSRASQGAIVVKTKRGKNGPPKITYSGKFAQNDAISHPRTMSAYEYGVFANRYGKAAGWTPLTNFYSDAELEEMKSLNYDWLKEAWQKANSGIHSINVSGGNERATYFAGASYAKQGANLGNQDYGKWTFRTGTDIKVANNLKLSATIGANNGDVTNSFTKVSINSGYASNQEQNDYVILSHMPRYIPWKYNVNGVEQYIAPAMGPRSANSAVSNQNNIGGWNYFALLNNGSQTTTQDLAYNANFSLQYDIPYVKGLSVKGAYGLTYSVDNTEQAMLPQQLALLRNTNQAGTHLFSSATAANWLVGINNQGARATFSDVIGKIQQMNFFVNYDRSIGEHAISFVGSVEKSLQDYRRKFVMYDNPIAGAYNGASSSAGTINASNTAINRSEGGGLSYLARLSYNYKSKYLLQLVFRTDASTKFAPENYWGVFPGVSAGWTISSEDWFRNNVNWVNNLKLRTSVGVTGKDNVAYWSWLQQYGYAQDKGFQFGPASPTSGGGALGPSLSPNPSPNRNVKWDKTTKYNVGVDFGVMRNRLSGSFDFYYDKLRDLLTQMSAQIGTPISVGGAFAEENYSSVNAWGWEVSLNWKDKIGKDINYGIGVNFSRSNNKVVKWYPVNFDYPSKNVTQEGRSTRFPSWGFRTWKGTSTGDGILRTDADIDNYWNYLTDLATKAGTTPAYFSGDKSSIKKGQLAYEDQAGNLDANSKTIAGTNGRINADEDYVQLAKANASWGVITNLTFGWKSINFAAQISTSWGGYTGVNHVSIPGSGMFWNKEAYLTDMYDETDNVNGKYPNLARPNVTNTSDFWQLSSFRSYVRTLSIGYTIPREWAKAARLENARLFVSGNNLWDFYNPYPSKYRNMYDAPNTGFPTLRTWALGINVGF